MHAARALLCTLLLATASVWADDAAEVRAFIAEYDRAYLASDTATTEKLIAPDYLVVVEGRMRDRAEAMAEMTKPDRAPPTSLNSTIERVHTAGDLAVAVGRIDWAQGKESGGEHFTMVLRRDGGQWRVVTEHISVAAKDAGS